jgi:3-methyl-2-oxobutanoate hydroxymethyltransferase
MPRVTAVSLRERKKAGDKIAVLTAYDFPTAKLMDEAGIDVLLVGDSCGMAVQGRENTLGVTMEQMLYHTEMVSRAAKNALVVGDMPFMSYQISRDEAVRNAGRFVAEAGAHAVKLEGPASKFGWHIHGMIEAGIPVMGHLGLTPQSINAIGGYKVQGREPGAREQLLRDARELDAAGCFALVLECVPGDLARDISMAVSIPTIGIGAGPECDGQVLVMQDMLGFGMYTKFSKVYGDAKALMTQAFTDYRDEVRAGSFPTEAHSFR